MRDQTELNGGRFFVPNLTGEDLLREDEEFEKFLLENGWTGEVGEDGKRAVPSQRLPNRRR